MSDTEALSVLLIGCNRALLRLLGAERGIRVFMLEERTLHARRPEHYQDDVIAELRFAEYQHSDDIIDVALEWARTERFDAVIAGGEHAVSASHALASRLHLPTCGGRAVEACTDKLALRQMCEGSAIKQPDYTLVRGEAEVREFFARQHGQPIVLKPTDRSGSAGVIKVAADAEVRGAWTEAAAASEPLRVRASAPARYLAEAYIPGYEVSTEAIVAAGEMRFCNVTLKDTTAGRYFAETGHLAPAPIPDADRVGLESAQRELLRILDAQAGIFHTEWKVTPQGPHLIECAARPPGDFIPIIISRAWDFNLAAMLARSLAGREVKTPARAIRWAAARFFVPPTGVVRAISGEDELARHPSVLDYEISARPGAVVGAARDTWSRSGHYLVEAETLSELRRAIADIEAAVEFAVEPTDSRERSTL